ncbi:FUSC family protein [Pseudomonas sp. GD03858]|uniref:FUSC family protein n=1 Tax=unclassified Pseudomonas TaxID=196821 RepID=UPI00244B3331|nr:MULTISPECIES: FUSC family protein [unclassified Pseudomonas]MDH0647095.1 FUSC family protein [Pseudomonas sp. GD03867]MDH0662246.1 FUSC family protein [Pseudomonas sp. GD03858]
MNGFFSSVPPARDWFYGVRTFAASMIALYIALLMQLPRPYWAMATVYIVSSPFLGPTTSKALYRALGTLLGAGGAILLVPPLVQSPLLLSIAIALWTGTLLFLSLNLRTANNYVLMLAGYTLPMIALAVVDNPLAVFDVASSRAQEICLGIVCAAVVGAVFWPRRLAPVVLGAADSWFSEAIRYSDTYLAREAGTDRVGGMRGTMVATFNSLEPMIGQLGHEGAGPHTLKNARELRGRMIHLLPVIDALDDALIALQARAPEQFSQLQSVLDAAREWLKGTADSASVARWTALHEQIDRLQPGAAALDQRAELLLSNALYRLTEWVDLWQDCCSLQHALRKDDATPWRAVYRHWRLARLTPFFDRGLMLYSVFSTVTAIVVACGLWIGLGWNDGASAVILAAVSCSFFAAMDDPAPQIYRFFFWTLMSVIFSSLYLFLVLPNLHDFPMLVLAFAVPFICVGTLTVQPRFYLGTLLTIVNTSTFISIQGAYDADFFTFINANLAGPVGLLFAFIWTLVVRPFGVELAAKRMTRFAWRDIVEMTEPATLAEHRQVGVQMLDRLMQHLPRLSQTGQDSGVALRDLRVGLNLLDLLAYMPRAGQQARERLRTVIEEVGAHYAACLRANRRLHAPATLLRNMEGARQALNLDELYERGDARTHLLHALSGLRLALLPGVEVMLEPAEQTQLPPGLDGAPL